MFLNLRKHQRPDMDKIYLYVKDPFETKYQLLIKGREKVEIENFKNPEVFNNCLMFMKIWKTIIQRRLLILF